MTKLIDVTHSDFSQQVLESDLPVVVDFTAYWCPPCRRAIPILEEIATDYGGRIKVVEVDTDQEPQLVARYGVQAMPTMLIFRHGQEIERLVGLRTNAAYRAILDRILAEQPVSILAPVGYVGHVNIS
jgi:thioredoxin 1